MLAPGTRALAERQRGAVPYEISPFCVFNVNAKSWESESIVGRLQGARACTHLAKGASASAITQLAPWVEHVLSEIWGWHESSTEPRVSRYLGKRERIFWSIYRSDDRGYQYDFIGWNFLQVRIRECTQSYAYRSDNLT